MAKLYRVGRLGDTKENERPITAPTLEEAAKTYARWWWTMQLRLNKRPKEELTLVINGVLYSIEPDHEQVSPITWEAS